MLLERCAAMPTTGGVKREADAQVPGNSGVLGQGAEEQKGETARLVRPPPRNVSR